MQMSPSGSYCRDFGWNYDDVTLYLIQKKNNKTPDMLQICVKFTPDLIQGYVLSSENI